MKMTKKLEEEIRQVYDAFWESLLSVNMRKFNSLLDENFKQIGTTEAEVFFNKKTAAKFLKSTEEQVVGNIERRNHNVKIEPLDKLILIIDQSDAYVKINSDWVFYARARTTSLLHKKEGNWKFIQQHISLPDNRTQEGETIALEKISKENLELRSAIKRRTIELENKNRELQIEAALERVRAVAMSMHKSEELIEVSKILKIELDALGFQNIRNTQIAIANDAQGSYMSYDYYNEKRQYVGEIRYDSHPFIKTLATKFRKNKASFVNVSLTGKELNNWRKHLKSLINTPAPKLDAAKGLHYYYYSIGSGGLGFCAYTPLDKPSMELLRRFKNVFELAYRRYADIEKAEAQAREAEIELALERVRARTMAMQRSDELGETAPLLFINKSIKW